MRRPTIFGHPWHPIAVHLPIGALVAATTFRVLGVAGLDAAAPARWALAFGLVGAGLAMATGLVDLLAAPEDADVERRLAQHVGAMGGATACYAAAWAISAPLPALALHLLGLALLAAGGRAGGELVYGHGVGVRSATGDEPCDSRPSPAPAERSSSR